MKLGDDVQHDKAVFLWFKQKRMEGVPITGPILCEKAVQLHKKLYGDRSQFSGSTGWQWRFCKCHGIRNLSLQGEKLSGDNEASDEFVSFFAEFVEQHQIFNCDDACPITSSHPAHMLEKCLTWLEYQPEANEYNVCTPRQLRTLAARKCLQSLKQRTLMGILPSVNCGDIQNCIQFSNVNVHV